MGFRVFGTFRIRYEGVDVHFTGILQRGGCSPRKHTFVKNGHTRRFHTRENVRQRDAPSSGLGQILVTLDFGKEALGIVNITSKNLKLSKPL